MSDQPAHHAALRNLPAVSKILATPRAQALAKAFGEGMLKYQCRLCLDALRGELIAQQSTAIPDAEALLDSIELGLKRRRSLEARRAINATGVLLHTNLGRAPLGAQTSELLAASAGYGVVQVNLDDNSRSDRDEEIAALLQVLTGCRAATVVNNNAAATFMLLNSMAAGKEVIISRGQLVEIGGSYRMPDVMEQSGALLREVGTTNRTHLSDYEKAINEQTGALLYVDPSNYQVIGFAGFPSLEELCELGKKHQLPVIADLGSGALVSTARYGIKDSLTIAEALRVGATVTCSSGDKLIGGPQAGIICGDPSVVKAIRKSPFARMFRVDKLTLTGIEATLQEFVNGSYEETIPLYQMMSKSILTLQELAETLCAACSASGLQCDLKQTTACIGGGSLPAEQMPSVGLCVHPVQKSVEAVARELRLHIPPIFCRIEDNALLFDMRSLLDGDLELLARHLPMVCA